MSADTTSRRRILAVDDDELERDGAARILSEVGHRVDTAASRDDAVSLLGARAYGLVVSDLKMPSVNRPAFYDSRLSSLRSRCLPPISARQSSGCCHRALGRRLR